MGLSPGYSIVKEKAMTGVVFMEIAVCSAPDEPGKCGRRSERRTDVARRWNNPLPLALGVDVSLLFLLSIGLAFSGSIWFDESYTLALVRHDYPDIIRILKNDMHPPFYFISLKLWLDCFGYSLAWTKLFSSLGLLATLLLGCTLVRKDFGTKAARLYILFVAAMPMVYYFSVQQRCYSWCIFWVALCFVMGLRIRDKTAWYNYAAFAAAFLCSAYNHTYGLVAAGGIALFVNLYCFFYRRNTIRNIIITDLAILAGYAPWLFILVSQTRNAISGFWLTSLEPLSILLFAVSVVVSVMILRKKENRRIPVMAGLFCILFVQVLGLGLSLVVRPLYIARYAAPLMGIFALVLALCTSGSFLYDKKRIAILIGIAIIFQYILVFRFEYADSLSGFREEFAKEKTADDIFLYSDTSFGVMSYYYPDDRHLCFCYESWFEAWENVRFIDKDSVEEQKSGGSLWYVVNRQGRIPDWMKERWDMALRYSFRNDFNTFDVYLLENAQE